LNEGGSRELNEEERRGKPREFISTFAFYLLRYLCYKVFKKFFAVRCNELKG